MLILSPLAASPQDVPPCDCADVQAAAIVCSNDMQMSTQVKHIEMQSDRMGKHVNFRGVAVFELMVGKNGRVLNAKAISGHPIAIHLLLGSVDKWRFKPLIRDGVARQTCGRLTAKFSIVENVSNVQVERSTQRINRVRIPSYLAESMTRRVMLPHDIGISGVVVLEVLVEKNGRVLNVRGVSGDSRLIRAARPPMMKWVFNPYLVDGEPVQFLTELTIQFDGNKRSAKLKIEIDPLTTR